MAHPWLQRYCRFSKHAAHHSSLSANHISMVNVQGNRIDCWVISYLILKRLLYNNCIWIQYSLLYMQFKMIW